MITIADLEFEYDEAFGGPAGTYDGLTVTAHRDDYAGNPWLEWDGQPPMATNSSDGQNSYGGAIEPLADVTDDWIRKNWLDLCAIFDILPEEALEYKATYEYDYIADARRDLLDELWAEASPSRYSSYSGTKYLQVMEALCILRGWPVHHETLRGYSQGDWIEALLVHTPDYAKEIGANMPTSPKQRKAREKSLAADAQVFAAWAFGDVYGFVITPEDEPENILESCAGFYGCSFEESGLLDCAVSLMAGLLEQRKNQRAAKLKQLIRAGSPLAIRPEALANAVQW